MGRYPIRIKTISLLFFMRLVFAGARFASAGAVGAATPTAPHDHVLAMPANHVCMGVKNVDAHVFVSKLAPTTVTHTVSETVSAPSPVTSPSCSMARQDAPQADHPQRVTALLRVGPTRTYKTVAAAAAVAQAGDTIEIDASTYLGDYVTWQDDNLTIRGVGGRPHIQGNGPIPNGKALWVIQGANTSIDNIEFSHATVADKNGAGIRQEGAGLIIRHSFFHDNENGILTSSGNWDVLIEYCEFANNGLGDGYTHNIYIGTIRRFTLQHSYSHHAKIGHTVKSRAQENYLLYNRIMDEASGTASYEIDLPNGGRSYVIGNLIQQGPATANAIIVSYAAEGGRNADQHLYLVNNTIVNDRTQGGTFLRVNGTTAPLVKNNLFVGPGTLYAGPGSVNTSIDNIATTSPGLVNQAGYDYHLTAGSTARDTGTNPGSANGVGLTPAYQYVHPTGREARPGAGALDMGAYEYASRPPLPKRRYLPLVRTSSSASHLIPALPITTGGVLGGGSTTLQVEERDGSATDPYPLMIAQALTSASPNRHLWRLMCSISPIPAGGASAGWGERRCGA